MDMTRKYQGQRARDEKTIMHAFLFATSDQKVGWTFTHECAFYAPYNCCPQNTSVTVARNALGFYVEAWWRPTLREYHRSKK